MTGDIYVGNADTDAPANRGWLLGHFQPPGDPRRSAEVEVKWGVHPVGEERREWVTAETRAAMVLLMHGRFRIELPGRSVLLAQPGDYVVFARVGHSWRAETESVVVVVRWPSVPGYAIREPGEPAQAPLRPETG